jgi:hypothetical protein
MRSKLERVRRAEQLQQLAASREKLLADQAAQAETAWQELEGAWRQLSEQQAATWAAQAGGVVQEERLAQTRAREREELRAARREAQHRLQHCRRELAEARQEKGALDHLLARLQGEVARMNGREEQGRWDDSAQVRHQQGRV